MSRDTAISVAGLHKTYGDSEVLKGVDLEVPEGSVYALLGPNGAGKTTAVSICSTLLTADAGEMRDLGLPEPMIEGERDAWILVAAHSPEWMARWIALKREQLEEPVVVELYRQLWEMVDWQPDDPRLPELADWLASAISDAPGWEEYDSDDALAAGSVELVDSMFVDAVPAGRRLMQLLEERGWSGWTQLEPVTTDSRR